jgi:Fic family protein
MRKVEKPPYVGKLDSAQIINEIVASGYFSKVMEIDGSSYPYWEKWKYRAKEWNLDAKKLWAVVKIFRDSAREINFSDTDSILLRMNTPDEMQRQLHELDMNLGGSLHTGDLIPSEEKQRYLVSSLMEEAIASSQLEGAATTRRIAKEMLESNRKPRNHSEQMIVNNYAAMQWIVSHKNADLTPGLMLQLHQVITANTLQTSEEEGAFGKDDEVKIVDVQTGTVLHTPPTYRKLQKLMNEFCLFANDRRKESFFLHPVAKSIVLLFLIGYIHPFADGNGRTARALFYWYLIRKGYWLIEYMSVSRIILRSKAQYARAYQYTELDDNDLTYFVLYNLNAIRISLDDLKKYIGRKNREKNEMLNLLRNTDYNDRQIVILQELRNQKKNIYTVTEVEVRFGVSNQTARNDLNQLVERGILISRKSGKTVQFISTGNIGKKLK